MNNAMRREGDYFVAQCRDVNVSGSGASKDEALANLQEAVELYLEED